MPFQLHTIFIKELRFQGVLLFVIRYSKYNLDFSTTNGSLNFDGKMRLGVKRKVIIGVLCMLIIIIFWFSPLLLPTHKHKNNNNFS